MQAEIVTLRHQTGNHPAIVLGKRTEDVPQVDANGRSTGETKSVELHDLYVIPDNRLPFRYVATKGDGLNHIADENAPTDEAAHNMRDDG